MSAAFIAALGLAAIAPSGPAREIAVEPQPLDRAVLELALQLDVSLGGEVAACGRTSRGLRGVFTAAKAFDRLTRRAPCRVVRLDAQTFFVRIATLPRVPAPPPRRPALNTPAAPSVAEVVVTGERSTQALSGYTGSAALLDQVDLGGPGRRDLSALTRDVALLETTNLGPGRDKLFLRGLSDSAYTGSAQSTVAVYLDDLPIAYNAPDPDLRLADVDRVEVLAGPQGALFGAGSIGGVVRIVARQPDLRAFGGSVEVGGSATTHGGLGSDAEAVINAPLVPDRLAVRVVGYREDDPGYIDDTGLDARDVNDVRREGVRASALLRLSDAWSATATFAYQDIDSAGAQYVLGGSVPLTRATRVAEPQDNDFGVISVSADGHTSFGSLKLSAAYVRHTSDTVYDASDSLALFAPALSGAAAYDETHRRELAFAEAVATSAPGGRASWTLGAFVAHSTDAARERLDLAPAAGVPVFREDRLDQFDEAALFGEAAYRVAGPFTVRAGLRVFRSTITTTARDQDPALQAGVRGFAGSAVTLDAVPKVAFEYRASPRLFAYVSFSSGYRPASFNTSGPIGQTFEDGGPEPRRVAADAARTYEAGIKWTGPRSAFASVEVFYTDWLDVQSDQYSAFRLPVTVNIGDAVVPGLEASGRWPLSAGVSVHGSLLLDDPHRVHDGDITGLAPGGSELPGVAPVSAALGLDWRRELLGLTAEASARARYVGRSRLTFNPVAGGEMGGYVDAAVELSVARGRWSVDATLENLADVRADTFAFGDPFTARGVRQSTPLRPRTLSFTLRRSF